MTIIPSGQAKEELSSESGRDYDSVRRNDKDILMAIDLGYDESGEGDVLLVSMQIGVTEKIKRANKLWRAELKKAGIPFFHSKEFKSIDKGVFSGLNKSKRERLLQNVSQLIRLRFEIGITAKISQSFYNEKTTPEFRGKWATAYSFAIQMLILGAHIYLQHFNLGFDVNILIEDGHRNAKQALEILQDLKAAPKNEELEKLRILTVGLGSKKDHPILQAADMLAYSEWAKISGGDLAIYNALHVEGSRYDPEIIDCNEKLIDISVEGVREHEEKIKSWGRRRKQKGK